MYTLTYKLSDDREQEKEFDSLEAAAKFMVELPEHVFEYAELTDDDGEVVGRMRSCR